MRNQAAVDSQAIVEVPESGGLQLHMRSDSSSRGHPRFVALSADGGERFGPATRAVNLTGPPHGCQASLLRGGPRNQSLYFANPSWAGGRTQLTLRRSTDGGVHWPRCTEAQRMGPARGCAGATTLYVNSSSYSSLAPLSEALIGAIFERGDYADNGCAGVSCRISFVAADANM